MLSALNLCRNRLLELRDDVKLRSSAIAKDEEKLRIEVDALEADLKRLEICHNHNARTNDRNAIALNKPSYISIILLRLDRACPSPYSSLDIDNVNHESVSHTFFLPYLDSGGKI
jgi:hypothetical protein